ncbi:hypothetical protein D3C72_2499780 [compost metagenome]
MSRRITVTCQVRRLAIALQTMHITYRLWDMWKDGSHPLTRRNALVAKTRGLIAYDRIMCLEERP